MHGFVHLEPSGHATPGYTDLSHTDETLGLRNARSSSLDGRQALINSPHILKQGHIQKVFLWNAPDHGYLTVYSAYRLLNEGLQPGKLFDAGRLGSMTPQPDEISMQVALPVLIFTKHNIDEYDF
jgi:hypothetical protein